MVGVTTYPKLREANERVAALVGALDSERVRVRSLEAKVSSLEENVAKLEKERRSLRIAYEAIRIELEMLKRRIFVASAERVDNAQLEMDFGEKLAALDRLVGMGETAAATDAGAGDSQGASPSATADDTVNDPDGAENGPGSANGPAQLNGGHAGTGAGAPPANPKKKRPKPKGRRDLRALPMEEVRVEVLDPALEEAILAGRARRIGFQEASSVRWRRGGHVRFIAARGKYVELTATPAPSLPAPIESTTASLPTPLAGIEDGATAMTTTASPKRSPLEAPEIRGVYTVPMPPMVLPRCIAAPSLLAHIFIEKYCDGLPFNRISARFRRDGLSIDRGAMSRWSEEVGGTLGSTVVAAMRKHALATAFCIATDATGVAIQPPREKRSKSIPCNKGHFLIQIADADHVIFEYLVRETSIAIEGCFTGFNGYVQADAKSVFDLLYLSPEQRRKRMPPRDDDDDEPDESVRIEVGCWSHCRRKFWEAAIARSELGREGLAHVNRIFALERSWNGKPPDDIKVLRQKMAKPLVEAFIAWAEAEYKRIEGQRGYARTAVGYVARQKAALVRFLEDGRLVVDNNRSERGLRTVATGRKAWLFFGSDDHAESAAAFFSLIGSCRLHGIEPEAYLRDVICLLAQWPKDRYLELAPLFWKRTRARLDDAQLENEIAFFTIPPPLDLTAEQ